MNETYLEQAKVNGGAFVPFSQIEALAPAPRPAHNALKIGKTAYI